MLVFLLVGCHPSSPLVGGGELPSGRLSGNDKYARIPRQLISEIEGQYLHEVRKLNPQLEKTDGEIVANIPRRSIDLVVDLAATAPGILRSNAHFGAGRGGGVLDLADWVTGVRGDFYISAKVNLVEQHLDGKGLKVYFISRAPRVKIDEEYWGMGCGSYAEITHFYHQTLAHQGWRLNSTDKRYLFALAGTYLFTYVSSEELFLTTLTVTDSRYSHLLCSTTDTRS